MASSLSVFEGLEEINRSLIIIEAVSKGAASFFIFLFLRWVYSQIGVDKYWCI
jgi:hypothetical protein